MVHFLGIIFYGIFASGEKQPWAEPPEEDRWRPEDTLKPDGSGGKLFSYGAFHADDKMNGGVMSNGHVTNSNPGNGEYGGFDKSEEYYNNGYGGDYGKRMSFDAPLYNTKEELVQVQSKDSYLNDKRDL